MGLSKKSGSFEGIRSKQKWVALALVAILSGCDAATDWGGVSFNLPDTADVEFELGDVVAEFELAAPPHSPFLLHGTVPIPPGMYLPGSTTSPFLLNSAAQQSIPTQVEVVSRYPSETEGADVVEVLALVEVPAGSNPGDRISFEVVWSPNTSGALQLDADVAALIATPNAMQLRSSDVFGHQYTADLLGDLRQNTSDLRTVRDGHLAHQVRTYENLDPVTPVAGVTGTLPHMMGVHSYVTTWDSEPFFALDLRLHNAHEGLDPATTADDPVGKLYFNELDLLVPAGWKVFQAYETPSMGTLYAEGANIVFPVVEEIGGGKLHVMAIQAQFHRRLIVCRDGSEAKAQAVLAEEGLAFCRDGENANEERLMSWWNPGTARYWGQNLPLPTLEYKSTKPNFRTDLEADFAGLKGHLQAGTAGDWPNVTGNLGWAHPAGLNVGYAHGGHHIVWFEALEATWSASTEGYRSYQIAHRMYTERHNTALFANNGNPYQLEKWLLNGAQGPYLPTYFWTIPWLPLGDPHGFTTADTFQIDAVADQGRQPDYEAALMNYQWIDTSHLIRYTRNPKVLAWIGNDAIAKDDLRMQAELSRSSWAPYPQSETNEAILTGLWVDMEFVAAHPNGGIPMDRQEGWIIDAAASYYALADPLWRHEALPWFETITDVIWAGRSGCSGVIMSTPHSTHLGGNYRLIQSVSEAVIQNGLWGVRTGVFERANDPYADKLAQMIVGSTAAMTGPLVWDPTANAMHFYTALGPYDQNQSAFCSFVPPDGHSGTDGWQTWNTLVYGYMLTGNPSYLTKAALMGGGTLTAPAIGNDTWAGELEVRAGMVALIQGL